MVMFPDIMNDGDDPLFEVETIVYFIRKLGDVEGLSLCSTALVLAS